MNCCLHFQTDCKQVKEEPVTKLGKYHQGQSLTQSVAAAIVQYYNRQHWKESLLCPENDKHFYSHINHPNSALTINTQTILPTIFPHYFFLFHLFFSYVFSFWKRHKLSEVEVLSHFIQRRVPRLQLVHAWHLSQQPESQSEAFSYQRWSLTTG